MAEVGNWVGETTATTGTGDITLSGAIEGFTTFASHGDGQYWYAILDGVNRESGICDVNGDQLIRTLVIATLIDGEYDGDTPEAIILSGDAEVFCTFNKAAFDDFMAGGETNAGENIGSGVGMYAGKMATDLQFKSLIAGENVSITSTLSEVTINAEVGDGDFVLKSGDMMEGYLTLFADAVNDMHAVTLDQARTAYFASVKIAGDTMTGPLILSQDAVGLLGAATKQQMDVADGVNSDAIIALGDNVLHTVEASVLLMADNVAGPSVPQLPLSTPNLYLLIRHQNNSSPANALTQLDASGHIPLDLLPSGVVTLVGFWSVASDGSTPPVLPGIYAKGDTFIFTDEGNMTLLEGDNQTPHTIVVEAGDAMVALLSVPDFVDGWYYLDRAIGSVPPASLVTFDKTGTSYDSDNVQAALEEIDGVFGTNRMVKHAGDTMSGDLIVGHNSNPIVGAVGAAGGVGVQYNVSMSSADLVALDTLGVKTRSIVSSIGTQTTLHGGSGIVTVRTGLVSIGATSGGVSLQIGSSSTDLPSSSSLLRNGFGIVQDLNGVGDAIFYETLSNPAVDRVERLSFVHDQGVRLWHGDAVSKAIKLETTALGATVTGLISCAAAPVLNTDLANKLYVDSQGGGGGDYLPLTGGTLTGPLNVTNASAAAIGITISNPAGGLNFQVGDVGNASLNQMSAAGVQEHRWVTFTRNQGMLFKYANINKMMVASDGIEVYNNLRCVNTAAGITHMSVANSAGGGALRVLDTGLVELLGTSNAGVPNTAPWLSMSGAGGVNTLNILTARSSTTARSHVNAVNTAGGFTLGVLENGDGYLRAVTSATPPIQKHEYMRFEVNKGVKAMYNGTVKLETTADGVKVVGNLEVTGSITSGGIIYAGLDLWTNANLQAFIGTASQQQIDDMHAEYPQLESIINIVWGLHS